MPGEPGLDPVGAGAVGTRPGSPVDSAVCGLRLTQLREGVPAFAPFEPSDLWSTLHRPGLVVSVRWLVLPSRAIGHPGHVEVAVLISSPDRVQSDRIAGEFQVLLSLAYPELGFQRMDGTEVQFALRPLDPVAWTTALSLPAGARSAGAIGFSSPDIAGAGRQPALPLWLAAGRASQALALLAGWPTASLLEWRLWPAWPTPEERRSAVGDHLSPDQVDRAPFFACEVLWAGAGGPAPDVAGAAMARALGAEGGTFVESPSRPASCPPADEVGLPARVGPRAILLPTPALPPFLPPSDTLAAVAPGLRAPFRLRYPDVELPAEGASFGTSLDGQRVALSVVDRLRHVWAIGQTGTGKSTVIKHCARDDMLAGRGFAALAPHDDLAAELLELVPASRRGDVVRIDVSQPPETLPSLNLLECGDLPTLHRHCGQALDLVTRQWPEEMTGPIFRNACSHALQVLAARFEEPGTIADLPRLFLDKSFRRSFLEAPGVAERVPEAVSWFLEGYSSYSEFTRSETLDYFIAKFGAFASNPVLRALVGRPRSSLNLRRIMDERRILLCSLGRHGGNPMATALVTAVLLNGIMNAALSRAELPQAQRVPFLVYCDEFQRVADGSTGAMLSEIRKFGVGLFLAHQYMDQLGDSTLAAILGNVGTRLYFRVGARDAVRLASVQPTLHPGELTRLPNFTAIAELLCDGVPAAPFVLQTPPPPDPQG